MVKKLADKISLYYVRKNIISVGELEVYSYGFVLLLSAILNLTLVISIAIIFDMLIQAVVFVLSFILLRTFGGGYHAKTHMGCVWAFFIVFVFLSFALSLLSAYATPIFVLIIAQVSFVFIWVFAPVEAKNKPLSAAKQKRMKKVCRTIALIFFTFAIWNFFNPFPFEHIIVFVFSGKLAGSISIAFAALMNKLSAWKLAKENN